MFTTIGTQLTENIVHLAPAAQGAAAGSLEALAQQLVDFIKLGLTYVLLPLLIYGFALMALSGLNPQWKQKGIETVKWAIIGIIGAFLIAGPLALWLQSVAGGGGGGM